MRADNQGEGGILALTALLPQREGSRTTLDGSDPDGHLRCGAALRRRNDHAGDHGPRCRRGAQARDAALRAVRRACRCGDFDWGVCDSAAWHASCRTNVWSDHGGRGLSSSRCSASCRWHVSLSFSPPSIRATHSHSSGSRVARVCGARCGLSGGHGRRGPVRRHGPLWKAPDSLGVVHAGPASASAELLWPGCAPVGQSGSRGTAILSAGTWLGSAATCRARDRRRHHCVTSPDFRRVFTDPTGHSTWLLPASRHRAHVSFRDRAGLRATGELGADAQHHR